jgi:3-oxoacyl-[acyl-carrier-protein] synthase II
LINITDTAVVAALGNDLDTLWERLLAGESGIRPIGRFRTDAYHARIAACIEDLAAGGGRSIIYELLDRLFATMGQVPRDAFLITASTKAGVDSLEGISRGRPAGPSDCLLSHVSDYIHKRFALTGGRMHINAACASSTIALARGASIIEQGRADSVLVCCFDIVTEFIFSGFCALQAMSPVPCMPFDRNRKGMNIGEGAAALLLMNNKMAEGKGLLGSVLGWSVSNDATHITAPAMDGCGLILAIKKALKRSGRREKDISAICAHGTGTVYNDLMELTSFKRVFGERPVPIFSVKGALGHTMGAAGGIEAALCLKAIAGGMIPPTAGFSVPEQGAEGIVSNEPQEIGDGYILSTNSGFGGVNAAVIIGKGETA